METQERACPRTTDLGWLCGALIAVALLGLPSILYPFHPDHAMFAYIGDRWLHGALPYRDAWDVKPPGVFAVFALAQLAFGRSMAAIRWADLIATLVAAAGLFALARRRLPARTAVFAPLLFGLIYFTSFEYQDSAQAESLAAPFAVFFVIALLRTKERGGWAWPALAGVLLGCMALTKSTLVALVLLAPYALSGFPDRRKRIAAASVLLAGLILPVATTALYFWHRGGLGYLSELLGAQKAYGQWPGWEVIPRGIRLTARFFRERPALDMMCLLAAASLVTPLRWNDRDRGLWWSWLGVALFMVAAQWRCHSYHFLVILPPLALLGGGALAEVWERGRASARPALRHAALALALGVFLLPVAMGMRRFGLAAQAWTGALPRDRYWACFAAPGWYPFENSALVADYVRAHTSPGDPILVYDYDPAIYYLSEHTCPTRHLSSEPIIGADHFPDALRHRWLEQQIEEVRANPPRLLIVGGCPACNGLAPQHDFAPPTIHFAGDDYAYLTHITKDRIYFRLSKSIVRR